MAWIGFCGAAQRIGRGTAMWPANAVEMDGFLLQEHHQYSIFTLFFMNIYEYWWCCQVDDGKPSFGPGHFTRKRFFPRASERRILEIVGVCISSSHLHIFSSSHLLIFTSSHLHTFSSSHLLTAHLHIFSSSHLLIFTSSHLLIFISSHLHIFSSSHLLIFTSAHLQSLLILTSSHLHILTSSHLLLLPSCPLALLPSPSFLFLFWRRGQGHCQRDGTKRNPFARTRFDRQKLR